MNFLVEILHPAHVHFFKHAIGIWRARGDEVRVLGRDKECANELLKAYKIPFESISALGKTKAGLVFEMAQRDWRMWRVCRSFRPDVLTGIMGVTIAQVGRVIRKPAVVFYDTENARVTNRFVYPLAHSVCTPDCYQGPVHGRHVRYPGYHELAYLHPNRFTPDKTVLRVNGVDPDKPFFVLRLVSWQASHDVGEAGMDTAFVDELVRRLSVRGRVLISSEKELPPSLMPYRFSCRPESMHHCLAFAQLFIGESATMASESAVLGTPALFVSDTGRGYTDEQERRYGLVFNFQRHETDRVLDRVERLLKLPDIRREFAANRRQLLRDKIDLTAWVVEYLDRIASANNTGH